MIRPMRKFIRHISHDIGLMRGSRGEHPAQAGALTIGVIHGPAL